MSFTFAFRQQQRRTQLLIFPAHKGGSRRATFLFLAWCFQFFVHVSLFISCPLTYTARFRTKYSVPCTASSAPFRGADPPRAEQRYAAGERFDWGSTRAALKITSVEGWSALAILINPAARSTGIFPVQTIFKRPTDYSSRASQPASERSISSRIAPRRQRNALFILH